MVRTEAEVARVRRLDRLGYDKSAIARLTGIPRSTVRMWLSGDIPNRAPEPSLEALPPAAFAYEQGSAPATTGAGLRAYCLSAARSPENSGWRPRSPRPA